MGSHNSKSVIQLYAPNFEIHSRDEVRGLFFLTERGSRRQFLFKQIPSADPKMTLAISKRLDKKKTLVHDNLVGLRDYFVEHQDPTLMMTSVGGALYEFPFDTLEDYRRARSRAKKQVTVRELWEILTGCCSGFSYLQMKNIQHNSVRSSNIYIDNTGRIKIADPEIKGLDSNYELFQKQIPGVYLSPNELLSLKHGEKMPNHNCYRSDVFALGIVLLELANLQTQEELYNRNKFVLKSQVLDSHVFEFSKRYGSELTEILSMMVQEAESKRVDWIQLQSHLLQNKNSSQGSQQDYLTPREHRETRTMQTSPKKRRFEKELLQVDSKKDRLKTELDSKATQQRNTRKESELHLFRNTLVKIAGSPREDPSREAGEVEKKHRHHHYTKTETDFFETKQQHPNKKGHKKHFSEVDIDGTFKQKQPRKNSPDSRAMKHAYLQMEQDQFIPQLVSSLEMDGNFKKRKGIDSDLLMPMITSELDKVADRSFIPKFEYKPKTSPDENLVEITARESLDSLVFTDKDTNSQSYLRKLVQKNYQELRVEVKEGAAEDEQQHNLSSLGGQESSRKREPFNKISNVPGALYVQEVYKQGASYEGWKLKGMRHGTGKFYYENGGKYEGEWCMNRMQGKGTMYYPSGEKIYEGMWFDDHFHGRGKLYNETAHYIEKYNYSSFNSVEDYWLNYQGEFQADMKHGFGILTLSNGEIYEGYFKDDMVHGEGIFRAKSGVIKGRWERNRLIKIL